MAHYAMLTASPLCRLLVAVTFAFAAGSAAAQEARASQLDDPKIRVFTGNASRVFADLVLLVDSGIMFPSAINGVPDDTGRAIVESQMARFELLEKSRFGPPLGWGGFWTGRNASGTVGVKIVVSNRLSKGRDTGEVVFFPDTKEPMAPAILSQLMAKAASTKMAAGDTVELSFPAEQLSIPDRTCIAWTEMTVTISGILKAHQRLTFCDARKN